MPFDVGPDVFLDMTLEENPKPYPYYGPTKKQPKASFNPYQDVFFGDFVLCEPCGRYCLPV